MRSEAGILPQAMAERRRIRRSYRAQRAARRRTFRSTRNTERRSLNVVRHGKDRQLDAHVTVIRRAKKRHAKPGLAMLNKSICSHMHSLTCLVMACMRAQ
ncbi:hypothetical protein PYCCODRAFT_1048930 [Trametes coccinea BRFM310]|uniref:Uncharacterized protein n=1 Tax=Trametes coccinea (strain BRFM310) TaxID=1353009 RepID=A0A1Y2IDG3_TRAC3|nr:hypothetical protein PYCCODRAFT_1048930 [Trametes coccinea BRFM310]